MSISNQLLDALLECSRTGQLTKAAKKLFITQSALSQRISALEAELNTTLLIRNRSGVTLTPAGESLVRYCLLKEQLEIETVAQVKGSIQKGFSGKIRIAGFSSVMTSVVFPSLQSLIHEHPNVGVEIIVDEIQELQGYLKRGIADFVLLDCSMHEPGVSSCVLGYEQNVLVQKKNYKGPDVYLDHDANDRTTIEYFRNTKSELITRRFVGDIFGILEGTRLGFGKAIVPKHLVEGRKEFEILNAKKIHKIPIVLYFNEHLYKVPLYQEILRLLTAGFQKMFH